MSPNRIHRPPLCLVCLSARPPRTGQKPFEPAKRQRHQGQHQHRVRCVIARKPGWAGAATPVRRIAIRRPQVPPGRASSVAQDANPPRRYSPRCADATATEAAACLLTARSGATVRHHGTAKPDRRRRAQCRGLQYLARFSRAAAGRASAALRDSLGSLARRLGTRIFGSSDAEARWRNWQIAELRGSLARGYRDPRFDALCFLRDAAEQLGMPVMSAPEEAGKEKSAAVIRRAWFRHT